MRKKKIRKKHSWAGLLFILPSLAGVTVFTLIPFADVVRRSFTAAVTGAPVGFGNYRTVFANTAFRLAASNTLRFTLICLPLLIVLSLALAVLLQNLLFGKNLLKSICLMPMAVPAASVVLVWKTLFHQHGLINALLEKAGLAQVGWMSSGYAFGVLVVSYLWKNLGYDMILWLAGLAGIPTEIYEAARVDGAGEWRCFLSITLPNLKSSLYTIAVLSFLNSFKVFREAWLVAGDYPHQSMYLLQHLYSNWFRDLAFDKIAAAAVVTAVVVFALIMLLQRVWETD